MYLQLDENVQQTKLKLHFIIQSVCPHGPAKTDYGCPRLFPLFLVFPHHYAVPWLFQVF